MKSDPITLNNALIVSYFAEQDCRRTISGDGYEGTQSVAGDGSHCLHWASTVARNVLYGANSITNLDRNFCRNPILYWGTGSYFMRLSPWCIILSAGIPLLELCDISYCGM